MRTQITFHTWWLLGGGGGGRVQQQQLQPVAALAGGAFLVPRTDYTALTIPGSGVPELASSREGVWFGTLEKL